MKVTYLSHSGFLIEWEHCYWLFDYYKGEIPLEDRNKKLFVFVSHSHRDHLNTEIFELAGQQKSCVYVIANEAKRVCKNQQDKDISFIKAWEDLVFEDGSGDEIKVHALCSTDCGVAFFLEYQGKTLYHAGDLHWWVWPGEPEEDNRKMTGSYQKEMEYLEGKSIDLAFTPLDPRQEEWYDRGADYLLEHAKIKMLFPMHFWGDFSIIDTYCNREKKLPPDVEIIKIEREGQCWEIPDCSKKG